MAGATLSTYSGAMRRVAHRVNFVAELLRAEMAPHRRRLHTALRMSTIGALGAGVMAACHVDSALGPYIIWTIVGGAGPMMTFRSALGFTIAAAAVSALAVPIAAILSETPWLMLPFIGALMTLMTYVVTTRRFGSAGLVLKVLILDTFYNIVFHPNDFAVATASGFGGAALAFGIIALFDNWLWRDAAETVLLEFLSESLHRIGDRFTIVANAYLDARPDRFPPPPPLISGMQRQLELLDRAASEGITPFRHAVLLGAISRTERLHDDVDRLTIVARENFPRQVRGMLHRELSDAVAAITAAMDELADLTPREIPIGPDLPPPPLASRVKPALQTLDAATLVARQTYLTIASGDEIVNFAAFVAELGRMAEQLGRRLDHPPDSEPPSHRGLGPLLPPFDPSLARYSVKVGLATMLGYALGVVSHHDNLSVILTTILIAGLPTYGASLHKMFLRIGGNLVGGIAAILAIMLITPNFETVPVYMIACFIVFLFAGYIGLSSGRIAYAGKQIGTAFILTFAGLSPTEDITGPLYRVWGIMLGVIIVTVVFFTIWPEYSSDSMLARLKKVFRNTMDLIPVTAVTSSKTRIDATGGEITLTLFELLNVVDDARLEGARSGMNPAAIVDACGTLRRLGHRFSRLDAERIANPLPALQSESAALYDDFMAKERNHLAVWLGFLNSPDALNPRSATALAASHNLDELRHPLQELNRRISENQFAEVSSWTIEQRRQLLGELQSLHRMTELTAELDDHLAKVPRAMEQ